MELRLLRSSKRQCKHAFLNWSLMLVMLLAAFAFGRGDDKPDRYDDDLVYIRPSQYLPFPN